MAKNKKKEENPMLRMPGALLWIFCCPLAVVIYGIYAGKKESQEWERKRRKKYGWNWWY